MAGPVHDAALQQHAGFKMPAVSNVTIRRAPLIANEYNVTYKVDGAEYATGHLQGWH